MAASSLKANIGIETDLPLKMRYKTMLKFSNLAYGDRSFPLSDFPDFTDIANKVVLVIPEISVGTTSQTGLIVKWNNYNNQNAILITNPSGGQDVYLNILAFYTY